METPAKLRTAHKLDAVFASIRDLAELIDSLSESELKEIIASLPDLPKNDKE